MFYQIKMIRKGLKPPVWRRAIIPNEISFSQLAHLLMEFLSVSAQTGWEFDFYRKKIRITENSGENIKIPGYTYFCAGNTIIKHFLDTEKSFSFRLTDGDFPDYKVEIEKEIISEEEKALIPKLLKQKAPQDDKYFGKLDICNELIEEKTKVFLRKRKNMAKCLCALSLLYDVFSIDVLSKTYANLEKHISDNECKDIFYSISEADNPYVMKNDRFLLKSTMNHKLFRELEKRQISVPFYLLPAEEINELAEYGYPAGEKVYAELRTFLKETEHLDDEIVLIVLKLAFKVFSHGGTIKDLIEELNQQLNENGIAFEYETITDSLFDLLIRVYNNTRQFQLRGHKPTEMTLIPTLKLSVSPVKKDLSGPDESFIDQHLVLNFKNGIKGKAETSLQKIYPNDPCPCGSGKKYKQCCRLKK